MVSFFSKGDMQMKKSGQNAKAATSKLKGKKQSPKQAIIKLAQALIRTVQKNKLPLSVQKKIARNLGNDLQQVESFAGGLVGCCYVHVDGVIQEVETTQAICVGVLGGRWSPQPCP
jgi:hypothetical protein